MRTQTRNESDLYLVRYESECVKVHELAGTPATSGLHHLYVTFCRRAFGCEAGGCWADELLSVRPTLDVAMTKKQ
jgi:hypothetical protein